MNKSITSILMDEHSVILKIIQSVDKWNNLWEKDDKKFEEEISKLISFCQNYADKIHHFKEEDLLFPKMIEYNPMLESGIIAELKEHHELFRELIQNTIHLLQQKKYADTFVTFKKYLSQLEDHIYIENNELFPMADSFLSENEKENLYFRAMDFDSENEKIKAKYLSFY